MAEENTNKNGKGGIYQIGNQFYYMEICFFNGIKTDDGEKIKNEIYIPLNIIQELVIKESLTQWWSSGHIVLQNDFQFLEKGSVYKANTGEKKNLSSIIVDRPDGRNKFCIRLYPVKSENLSDNTTELNREEFEICYDYVVYDVQDIPSNNAEKKYKKYLLWDERYQLFLERNLEFSSATVVKTLFEDIQSFESDLERTVPPNLLLKELLYSASLYPDNTDIKVGYGDEGSIKNPEFFISDIRDEEWDSGPDDDSENNRIFYTSPANSNVIDDINKILPYCQSSDYYPVLLTFGRTTETKRFSLKSLKTFFDESVLNQKERMELFDTKNADTGTLNNGQWRARGFDGEVKDESVMINFTSGQASKVTSYYFCPMSNVDDLNFCTKPFHTFDFSKGQFNINFSGNTIEDVFNGAANMTQGLYSKTNDGGILAKINKIKKESGMIKNMYKPYSFVPKNVPYIQMLKDFVFLNQALVFETYGLTFRRPGIFFTLESIHSGPEQNDFWDKFLGQWMIVEIEHKFTQESYLNLINANKVDAFSKIFDLEDTDYVA